MATAAAGLQNVRRLRYMFGVSTQLELNNFLEVCSIDTETRKREIRTEWARAADVFEGLRRTEAGEADTLTSRQLSPGWDARISELASDPVFASTFANYPVTFEEVEIGKLVACQRSVHAEYVQKLEANLQEIRGDLFRFCLRPDEDTTPVVVGRTGPSSFTASSENPGLRFLGGYEQPYRAGLLDVQSPAGQPLRAIILILGYGGSTVNAFRVGDRMILNNGFHRLYTLQKLGITHAPMVVQEVRRPKLELPAQITEFPRDYLVEDPRPALMKEFSDERLTCDVHQRGFMKALQVGWGVNESLVPR
jgi:hypothetical protein